MPHIFPLLFSRVNTHASFGPHLTNSEPESLGVLFGLMGKNLLRHSRFGSPFTHDPHLQDSGGISLWNFIQIRVNHSQDLLQISRLVATDGTTQAPGKVGEWELESMLSLFPPSFFPSKSVSSPDPSSIHYSSFVFGSIFLRNGIGHLPYLVAWIHFSSPGSLSPSTVWSQGIFWWYSSWVKFQGNIRGQIKPTREKKSG